VKRLRRAGERLERALKLARRHLEPSQHPIPPGINRPHQGLRRRPTRRRSRPGDLATATNQRPTGCPPTECPRTREPALAPLRPSTAARILRPNRIGPAPRRRLVTAAERPPSEPDHADHERATPPPTGSHATSDEQP
jgi:hypothetical protein